MPRFRENIRNMTPYIPPLEGRGSKDLLLLDFNEMTVKPSQRVILALKEFIILFQKTSHSQMDYIDRD